MINPAQPDAKTIIDPDRIATNPFILVVPGLGASFRIITNTPPIKKKIQAINVQKDANIEGSLIFPSTTRPIRNIASPIIRKLIDEKDERNLDIFVSFFDKFFSVSY